MYKTIIYTYPCKKKRKRIITECIDAINELSLYINTSSKYNIYNYEYEITTLSIPINVDLGKQLKNSTNPNAYFNQFLKHKNDCVIYTDGSKIEGNKHIGAACKVPKLNLEISKSLNNLASIFTAECTAINEAMNIALRSNENNVLIFTDSLSALQSLNSIKTSNKTNPIILQIKQKYNDFHKKFNNRSIQFYWIPSHLGIEGNESVDLLAKAATNKVLTSYYEIPHTDLFEMFKKQAVQLTNETIVNQASQKGKIYFELYYRNTSKPWFHNKNLNRETIVTINRCRANHYHLAASLARINVVDSSLCACGQEQNVNHILWQCELYDKQRTKLIRELVYAKLQLPLCIEILIAEPEINICKIIHRYLIDCKLKV